MKKQRLLSILILFSVLLSSLSLTSCGKPEQFAAYSLDYFDTATTIKGYETDEEVFNKISGEALALLGEYHRLFTIYTRYEGLENLCTVNDLVDGAHRTVTVDRRIIDMLLYAKEMYAVTDGRLNVAMGSVLSIWHRYRTAGRDEPWAAELPPMDKLREAAKHTNIDDVIIDEEACTVFLADPAMTLDVGAIAKGYAVEMVARHLESQGVSGYILNVGGNVRTVGAKPDGTSWIAGIENPDTEAEEAYLAYLSLTNESIVTSGSYQRFYEVEGVSYHHIIDKDTLMPAEGYLSVSVICLNSAQGDALSTALFCMPLEDGMALVESLPNVEVLWVLSDGTQHASSGFAGYTTTI